MGFPQIGGFKPTARIYKLGILLIASLTIYLTLHIATSMLDPKSTSFTGGLSLPNVLGGSGSKLPANLSVGVLPPARVSYDAPAPGERVNGAIVVLVRNSELDGLRKSMRMFEDRFNRKFKYPYVLLNDQNFTQEFRDGIAAITNNEVRYGMLDGNYWNYSPSVTPEETEKKLQFNKNRYLYGGSLSYRFMCRFQSGLFYKHPLVRDLDWYWRLEPDVEYYCDIDYDPFVFMRDNGIKYGFTIAPREGRRTVETLWNTTRSWIKENTDLLPEKSLVNWKGEIHWFEDIGYKHPGNMHCPRDPAMHSKCICDHAKAYTYRSACQTRFSKVNNMSKDRMLQILTNSEFEYRYDPNKKSEE
ncbi:hypothetical protein GGI25_002251 [Coemansia spiralis]|uniref:Nucleotide-diphospho-sugar transferase n=1 Tax=Coemansia spiralis TaxID=417178 RepID=A0A9W8G8W9_9FUNG|nr:hypothetical protein GGI25_002251 [Coemansia spiralis]